MRVTALIENDRVEGKDDLSPEFGLSLHVEVNGTTILFDVGASSTFADNAEVLGIDISDVGVAVVSHHHFDHGGGLEIDGDRSVCMSHDGREYIGQQ